MPVEAKIRQKLVFLCERKHHWKLSIKYIRGNGTSYPILSFLMKYVINMYCVKIC